MRSSAIMLIGAFVFRIGGYLYRFTTAFLLGPVGFGILNLAIPLQGILITIASGNAPAIAKYVSEYSAKDDQVMVKQVIHTSMKLVIILGLIFSVAIFLLAEPLAIGLFHKPEAVLPFQMVALITPFSVLVGAFRGTFQGVFQMGNIVITKAFEQVFMIISAIILILLGFYVAGAIIGTAIGFVFSAMAGYYLYKRGIGKKLKNINLTFTTKEELALAKVLLIFAFPVVITGLAELALFDFVGNFVVGIYMASQYIGYYGAATPIARLPLIISMAVATAVLPATAEAIGLENKDLLKKLCKSVLSICCPSGSSNVSGNNDICSTYNEITLHFTGLYEWSLSITDTCSWNAVFHYLYCFLQYSSGIREAIPSNDYFRFRFIV